jgi:hypothetical protein
MAKFITITEDIEEGSVVIEAHGFTDGSCRDATRPYEELFTVVDRKLKAEACAPAAKPTVKAR